MVVTFFFAPEVANAATANVQAEAELLLKEAVTLMEAKQFARACPKLEKVTKLVPGGIGAKLELAECYLGLGRMAGAWRQYVLAEALANRAGDPRVHDARFAARALKPKLATLTMVVPDSMRSLDGLTIYVDGLEQAPDSWGAAIPVDVGVHDVRVKATGRRLWRDEIRIKVNGEGREVTIPMLDVEPNVIARILWEPDFPQWRKRLIVAGSGLTGAAFGVGIAFAVLTHNKQIEATTTMESIRLRRSVNEMVCPFDRLDLACNELRHLVQVRDTYNRVMTASFIGAGVMAAATVTLRIVSGNKIEPRDNLDALVVVPSLSGISIMGKF